MESVVHKLGQLLASLLGDDFKYVQSRSALIRKLSDGTQVIAIDLLSSSEPKSFKLAMHAHVRLNVLEEQYAPFHPFLSAKDKKTNPTLVVNCDSLFSDKALAQSFQVNENNLNEIAANYVKPIRDDVIPFFEEYYSVENLVSSFEQADPKSWITSDRNTRYIILLSSYALESKWDQFDKVSAEYLEYCGKPFAQAYKPLATAVIEGLKK
ncbi:hypothetical protein L3V77_10620 [Vibrio sp. DW001]|uniref:hypothetical protein n=1 Tax=Vibrio sp. DW001 TaxID=2912315 RepID=UPI0023B07F1E|nr:hypothetical protein [Vibrio sp. DW001]WED25520.1 hypothetical protein L3V77_10620 [Vibrio sp. DW001]